MKRAIAAVVLALPLVVLAQAKAPAKAAPVP